MNRVEEQNVGKRLSKLEDLIALAMDRKSVVIETSPGAFYRNAAAFYVNWPLNMLYRRNFYHFQQIDNETESAGK